MADGQMTLFPAARMAEETSCLACRHFSDLKEPRKRSDGAMIFGYCFKDGDKDYSPNMGKGYAVFLLGGTACKQFMRIRIAAQREEGQDG